MRRMGSWPDCGDDLGDGDNAGAIGGEVGDGEEREEGATYGDMETDRGDGGGALATDG